MPTYKILCEAKRLHLASDPLLGAIELDEPGAGMPTGPILSTLRATGHLPPDAPDSHFACAYLGERCVSVRYAWTDTPLLILAPADLRREAIPEQPRVRSLQNKIDLLAQYLDNYDGCHDAE